MKHIAILGPANSIHIQRWVNSLSTIGYKITLITQHWTDALPVNNEVTVVKLKYQGTKGYFLNAIELRKWLGVNKPDLLHTHYASGYGTTSMLAKYPNTLLSVWGSDVYDFPYGSKFKKWLVCKNLLSAKKIASTSHAMAKQVTTLLPHIKESDIAITPFGVDTDLFYPKQEAVKQGLMDKNIIRIGTIKTISYNYGIDTLIKAFSIVRFKYSNTTLSLAGDGDGDYITKLKALSAELGVREGIDWLGYVEHKNVPDLLSSLDIYVCASRMESFGVAAIEAMSCGVACVLSNAPGLTEVAHVNGNHYRDHSIALIFDKDSPEDLANKLISYIENPVLFENNRTAGAEHVVMKYSWKASLSKMKEVYEEFW